MTTSIDETLHQFWPFTDLDLITEFEFYLIVWGFHKTFVTGAACQQRTLTPPDNWSCPTWGLASVLMLRPISPELVLFPNIPRYFYFALNCNAKMIFCSLTDNSTQLSSLIKICYLSMLVGVAIVTTHLYSSAGDFGVYSNVQYVDSWSWWALQTAMRTEEILETSIVIVVASRSVQSKRDIFHHCLRCCRTKRKPRITRVSPISITVRPSSVVTQLSSDSFMAKSEMF